MLETLEALSGLMLISAALATALSLLGLYLAGQFGLMRRMGFRKSLTAAAGLSCLVIGLTWLLTEVLPPLPAYLLSLSVCYPFLRGFFGLKTKSGGTVWLVFALIQSAAVYLTAGLFLGGLSALLMVF